MVGPPDSAEEFSLVLEDESDSYLFFFAFFCFIFGFLGRLSLVLSALYGVPDQIGTWELYPGINPIFLSGQPLNSFFGRSNPLTQGTIPHPRD